MSNHVYFKTDNGILYQGDALEVLKTLPDESVDTIITSPPYYQQRRYFNKVTFKKEVPEEVRNKIMEELAKKGIKPEVVELDEER